MLVAGDVFQQVGKDLRIGLAELLFGHVATTQVVGTIDGIVIKVVETAALVFLCIFAVLQNEVNILVVCLFIDLCIGEHVLH